MSLENGIVHEGNYLEHILNKNQKKILFHFY